MKRRLRRFLFVGVAITTLDVGLLVLLGWTFGWPWVVADGVSVVAAAVASYGVHRAITFNEDPHALIDHRPTAFVSAVAPAVVVDVVIVGLATVALGGSLRLVLVAKLIAVAAASGVRLIRYRSVLFAVVRDEQAASSSRFLDGEGPRLSVILPAYNAAGVVAESVAELRLSLSDVAENGGLEIIVADDGSHDDTAAVARAAGAEVVQLEHNRGKGAAVRAAMLQASGRCRIFTDVDLAYPPSQLLDLLHQLESGTDVVVGSRRHTDTDAVYRGTRLRELGSLVFNAFTNVALLGQYRDTQSGIKGFRGGAADLIFAKAVVDGFAFDVEIFYLVERYQLSLSELPVVLDNVDETTVRLAVDTAAMVRDVFAVRRMAAKGKYDLDPEEAIGFGITTRDQNQPT